MRVKTKTTTTYYLEITDQQACDLMDIAVFNERKIMMDIRDPSIEETLNALRLALASAGIRKGTDENEN